MRNTGIYWRKTFVKKKKKLEENGLPEKDREVRN